MMVLARSTVGDSKKGTEIRSRSKKRWFWACSEALHRTKSRLGTIVRPPAQVNLHLIHALKRGWAPSRVASLLCYSPTGGSRGSVGGCSRPGPCGPVTSSADSVPLPHAAMKQKRQLQGSAATAGLIRRLSGPVIPQDGRDLGIARKRWGCSISGIPLGPFQLSDRTYLCYIG